MPISLSSDLNHRFPLCKQHSGQIQIQKFNKGTPIYSTHVYPLIVLMCSLFICKCDILSILIVFHHNMKSKGHEILFSLVVCVGVWKFARQSHFLAHARKTGRVRRCLNHLNAEFTCMSAKFLCYEHFTSSRSVCPCLACSYVLVTVLSFLNTVFRLSVSVLQLPSD